APPPPPLPPRARARRLRLPPPPPRQHPPPCPPRRPPPHLPRRPRRPRPPPRPPRRSEPPMIQRQLVSVIVLPLLLGGAACSGQGFETKAPKVQAAKKVDGTVDDHSMCAWKGKADREASEVAGPGSIQPNVRRVYAIVGAGDDRHKILICREIDTNFD